MTQRSPQEISALQAVQRDQQRLSEPVDPRKLACLRNARLFLRGYSELRQLASWLHEALHCRGEGLTSMDACQRGLTPSGEAWPRGQDYRNLSACREALYSRSPYRTTCPVHNVTIHYEWKSVMWHEEYDTRFRQRVARAAREGSHPRVFAILSAGVHHFSQFADHNHAMHFGIHDSFAYPQPWLDSYYDGAVRLFDAFAPAAGRMPSNVCVLWRNANVGPRLGDAPGQKAPPSRVHHPSSRNGLHEWLNRFSSAIAARSGVPVLDTSDLTAGVNPPAKVLSGGGSHAGSHAGSTSGTRGAHAAEAASGRGQGGASASAATRPLMVETHTSTRGEGDYYHGFNSSLLLVPLVARMCAACSARDTHSHARR